jgi:hypothetical protein
MLTTSSALYALRCSPSNAHNSPPMWFLRFVLGPTPSFGTSLELVETLLRRGIGRIFRISTSLDLHSCVDDVFSSYNVDMAVRSNN